MSMGKRCQVLRGMRRWHGFKHVSEQSAKVSARVALEIA